jgi:single-stranded DNA-binding protein
MIETMKEHLMAHITIHGNLDSEPKLHTTAGGRKIAEIRVIETLQWHDGQGASHTSEAGCHTVFVSGADAEHSMLLHKGDTVLVEGQSYVDNSIDEEGGEGTKVSALYIGVSLDKLVVATD